MAIISGLNMLHQKIMVCDGEEKRTAAEELPQGNFQEVHLKKEAQTNNEECLLKKLKLLKYFSGMKEFRVRILFPNKINAKRKHFTSQNFYIL